MGHLNDWLEPVTPLVGKQSFTVSLDTPEQNGPTALYLWTGDAGDGGDGDYLVWKRPRFEGKPIPVHGDKPRPSDLRPILLRDLPLVSRTSGDDASKNLRRQPALPCGSGTVGGAGPPAGPGGPGRQGGIEPGPAAALDRLSGHRVA